MNTATPERRGGRVLIALDAAPASVAALATAAALAAELDAELAGLFVEDINLQRLLALPFARELCLLSGELRPLSQDEIERSWRRQADVLQRRLAEAAGPLRLRWSFRVARGRMAAELGVQAEGFDLVVLGEADGGLFAGTAVEPPAAARPGRAKPVLVLVEAAAAATGSVQLAAALARRSDAELVLLVHAPDEAGYRLACADAREALAGHPVASRCAWLPRVDGAALAQAARREAAACLVLAGRERFLHQAELAKLLDNRVCPVVLSR
jgi:hypothetical protein